MLYMRFKGVVASEPWFCLVSCFAKMKKNSMDTVISWKVSLSETGGKEITFWRVNLLPNDINTTCGLRLLTTRNEPVQGIWTQERRPDDLIISLSDQPQ